MFVEKSCFIEAWNFISVVYYKGLIQSKISRYESKNADGYFNEYPERYGLKGVILYHNNRIYFF